MIQQTGLNHFAPVPPHIHSPRGFVGWVGDVVGLGWVWVGLVWVGLGWVGLVGLVLSRLKNMLVKMGIVPK